MGYECLKCRELLPGFGSTGCYSTCTKCGTLHYRNLDNFELSIVPDEVPNSKEKE